MTDTKLPQLVRIADPKMAYRLVALAKADKRGYGGELDWLIDQEWERRRLPAATALHGPETVGEDVERRR